MALVMKLGIRSIVISNSPWRAETYVTPLLILLRCCIMSNTKDVKELMAYIRKNRCKGVRILSLHLGKIFSFLMPLSVVVGVSVAAYSELFDESKSTCFSEFAGR